MAKQGLENADLMSLDEKLDLINNEIYLLYKMCLDNGHTPQQIAEYAKPFLDDVQRAKQKRWLTISAVLIVVVAFGCGMMQFDPVYRSVLYHYRVAQIKVLPYWDWSKLYHSDCFIDNPFYAARELTEEDCNVCKDLTEISRIKDVSQKSMADDYILKEIPVIVTDATENWPAREKFSVEFLHELYSNNEGLKSSIGCEFRSNARIKLGNNKLLLKKAVTEGVTNWWAYWENCYRKSAKVFREYYSRPYFLPAMVESSESNWLFISSLYNGKKKKAIEMEDSNLIWYAQLKGDTEISLALGQPCGKICKKLKTTLKAGETLVLPQQLWILEVKLNGPGEGVALAQGGSYDIPN